MIPAQHYGPKGSHYVPPQVGKDYAGCVAFDKRQVTVTG